jgi:Rod binding domain-containing protein
MEAVKKNLMPPADKEKKLRESCEGFEAIFIQKMWEQMRATIPESGLLKGREEKFWQSMYDQELAKTMAGAGGIGLADMMYEQLSRGLRAASKDAADAAGGRPSGFAEAVAPAPLLRTATPPLAATAAGGAGIDRAARRPRGR